MRAFVLFICLKISFCFAGLAQREFINPPIFSEQLNDSFTIGEHALGTLSDGYVMRCSFVEGPESQTPLKYYLVKLDTFGSVKRIINLESTLDSLDISFNIEFDLSVLVHRDTISITYSDKEDWSSMNPMGHFSVMRFNKDLDVIDVTVSRDTLFGDAFFWSGLGGAVLDNKFAFRIVNGGYESNDSLGTPIYGHTLTIGGGLRSFPVYTSVPRFFNYLEAKKNRLLIVGLGVFTVLDTAWNTVIDAKVFYEYDRPPVVNSNIGGTAGRGSIVGRSYYFFLDAGCNDTGRRCVAAQKWSDQGEMVDQKVLFHIDATRPVGDNFFFSAQASNSQIYDGDTTIYAFHFTPSLDSIHWEISAVDTNLNLIWRKTISFKGDTLPWGHGMALSPNGKQLLVTGRNGTTSANPPNIPSVILTYLIDTETSSVRNISALGSLADEVFLGPNPASNRLYIQQRPGRALSRVDFHAMGSGASSSLQSRSGLELDISSLASGTYLAIGYDEEGVARVQQRIVVTR